MSYLIGILIFALAFGLIAFASERWGIARVLGGILILVAAGTMLGF